MKNKTLGVNDVMNVLGVKQSRAYSIIKKLNTELKQQGYLIIHGRVPYDYLDQRLNLGGLNEQHIQRDE
jgi:hypothetical protein